MKIGFIGTGKLGMPCAEAIAENSSGQALIATAELSDIVINNGGTLSELYESLEILTSTFNQNV